MLSSFTSFFGRTHPVKAAPIMQEARPVSPLRRNEPNDRKPVYSKVFRWRLPDGQTKEPQTVEITGSFNHWQRVALHRDGVLDAWHATIHHIPGNKTHHYMLLIDGEPAHDKTCDGFAVPHGPQEERYALKTDKGPRVFMMFAQTK